MEKRNVTQQVADYLVRQQMPMAQMAEELHISKEKLMPGYKGELDAAEFLALCAYLGINPREFIIEG